MKKMLFLNLFLIGSLSFAQIIEKDVVKSGGVDNNITSTSTGMYDGTKSKKAIFFYDKAFEYSTNQDFENAEKYYLKTIKEDPDFVEAYDNLGRIYRVKGELDNATKYYLKSIELYPDGIMAHQNMAVVYSINKEYNKAVKEYEEILRISPDNPEGYFGLANSYMVLAEFEKALENAEKALKLYKETDSHHLADGYYVTGLIHFYNKNDEEAKKYIQLAKQHGAKVHPQLEKALLLENKEVALITKEDYKEREQEVVNTYNWLLKTPLGTNPKKRKDYSAFLIKWMTGSPNVTIELSEKIAPYMADCADCLLIFMGGWTEYTLNTEKYNKVEAGFVATQKVIEFYLTNKEKIGKNKDIEKLIKLKEKNKLKAYIKKSL